MTEDINLIKSAANGDNNSFNQLQQNYEKLCSSIISSYSTSLISSGINLPDMYNEIPHIVWKASQKYDPTKNTKFSTWVATTTKGYCLQQIRNTCWEKGKHSKYDFFGPKDIVPECDISQDDMIEAINLLQGHEYEIFKIKYLEDNTDITWKEIGKKLGISLQRAHQFHGSGLKKIKSFLKKKNKLSI